MSKLHYTVVQAASTRELAEHVREYMKEGWQLHAGVSCAIGVHMTGGILQIFTQAMVKPYE